MRAPIDVGADTCDTQQAILRSYVCNSLIYEKTDTISLTLVPTYNPFSGPDILDSPAHRELCEGWNQVSYTHSIDIATLWGGLWYLFFEIQHDKHGKMCISERLLGNGCAPGPSSRKWQCTTQECSQRTNTHRTLGYSM